VKGKKMKNYKSVEELHDMEVFNQALEQEKICFEESRKHYNRWNILKLVLGYSAIAILICIMFICGFIIFNYTKFSDEIILSCICALFIDIVGLMVSIYKIVLKENHISEFKQTTKREL
jgi:hypothetical protein